MKRALAVVCAAVVLLAAPVVAHANPIHLYVDAAPNAYGSPNYAPWYTAAKADVVAGSFVNMRSGMSPGTLTADPLDMIVYSTGDLGKRLTWIYWLPGATLNDLLGKFQVRDVSDWDGQAWTYDWTVGDLVPATSDAGWAEPTRWTEYAGGVIGAFGDAWWATDNEALPFDTNANPYDETDAADIAALRAQIPLHQTYWTGQVRMLDGAGNVVQTQSLQVDVEPVPEPASMLLLGTGLVGVAVRGWRKRRG